MCLTVETAPIKLGFLNAAEIMGFRGGKDHKWHLIMKNWMGVLTVIQQN